MDFHARLWLILEPADKVGSSLLRENGGELSELLGQLHSDQEHTTNLHFAKEKILYR